MADAGPDKDGSCLARSAHDIILQLVLEEPL
jgi:hypothetical protein